MRQLKAEEKKKLEEEDGKLNELNINKTNTNISSFPAEESKHLNLSSSAI